jgi:hypothetical protein
MCPLPKFQQPAGHRQNVPAMFIWRHIRTSQNPPAPRSELHPLNCILIWRGMDNITNHMDDSPIRRWKIQPNLLIGVYFQRLNIDWRDEESFVRPPNFFLTAGENWIKFGVRINPNAVNLSKA